MCTSILDRNWALESLRIELPASIENLIIFYVIHYFETKELPWKKETRIVGGKVSTKTLMNDQD